MASTVLAPTALTPALALPSFCLCLFAWNPVTLPLARLTPPGLCLDSTFSGKPSRMPLPPLPGLGTLRPFPPCEGVNLEEARPLQETVLTLPSQGAWPPMAATSLPWDAGAFAGQKAGSVSPYGQSKVCMSHLTQTAFWLSSRRCLLPLGCRPGLTVPVGRTGPARSP